MITVVNYIREEKEMFVFEGKFQEHNVQLILQKEGGQMLINADDASRIFGKQRHVSFTLMPRYMNFQSMPAG